MSRNSQKHSDSEILNQFKEQINCIQTKVFWNKKTKQIDVFKTLNLYNARAEEQDIINIGDYIVIYDDTIQGWDKKDFEKEFEVEEVVTPKEKEEEEKVRCPRCNGMGVTSNQLNGGIYCYDCKSCNKSGKVTKEEAENIKKRRGY